MGFSDKFKSKFKDVKDLKGNVEDKLAKYNTIKSGIEKLFNESKAFQDEMSKKRKSQEEAEDKVKDNETSKTESKAAVKLNLNEIGISHIPKTTVDGVTLSDRIRNGFIKLNITPCISDVNYSKHQSKFLKLDPVKGMNEYKQYLRLMNYNFEAGLNGITVYAKSDSVQGGSLNISNSYGDSFIEGMANFTSDRASDLSQILGAKAMDLYSKGEKKLSDILADKVSGDGNNLLSRLLNSPIMNGIESGMNSFMNSTFKDYAKLLAGYRMTFPKVWKGGNASTELSFTVRLGHVPVVSDADLIQYRKHVLGPLSALILLAIPQSEHGETYKWPFYVKVKSPGICDFQLAAITSMNIQPVEYTRAPYTQIPPAFDVTISIIQLDDNMLFVSDQTSKNSEVINSVQRYLDAIGEPRDVIWSDDSIEWSVGTQREAESVYDKLRDIANLLKIDPSNIKLVDNNTVKIIGEEASKVVGNVISISKASTQLSNVKRDVVNQLDHDYKDARDQIQSIRNRINL